SSDLQPGVGADLGGAGLQNLSNHMAEKVSEQKGLYETIVGVLVGAIPTNPIGSLATSEVLQIILFAMFFGVVALYYPKKSKPIVDLMRSLEHMSLALTHGVMKLAPLGIFVLMIDVMAKSGFDAVISLSKYIGAVLVGLGCHAAFLLFIASTRAKKSPIAIIKALSTPLLT